jgi:hypothetical protein
MPDVLDKSDTLNETWLETVACCKFDTNPAAWLAGCRSCHRRSFWCEEHYRKKMLQLDAHPSMGHECRECGAWAEDFYTVFFTVPI